MMTESQLIAAVRACFHAGHANPSHCFFASVAETGRLNPEQSARYDRNGSWTFLSGDSLTISGMVLPLSDTMVLCDTHHAIAEVVWKD